MKKEDFWEEREGRAALFDDPSFSFFDGAEDENDVVHSVSNKRTKVSETKQKNYEYRRAFSEQSLLETIEYEPLKSDCVYWFLTQGDCDALSFLKLAINGRRRVKRAIISSWFFSSSDAMKIVTWAKEGRFESLNIYVGDIFPSAHKIEYNILKQIYIENPNLGRIASFNNHSKVIVVMDDPTDFWYCAFTSANMNTNPRAENTVVCLNEGLCKFIESYYNECVS